ncbi:hypothetical protein P4050_14475 [Pseudomonas aeruginosa]|nr:hypothetical protein [Pseudomonas aeruginosa]
MDAGDGTADALSTQRAAGIFSATFSMPATISDRVPVQARAIALMPE